MDEMTRRRLMQMEMDRDPSSVEYQDRLEGIGGTVGGLGLGLGGAGMRYAGRQIENPYGPNAMDGMPPEYEKYFKGTPRERMVGRGMRGVGNVMMGAGALATGNGIYQNSAGQMQERAQQRVKKALWDE